MNLGSLIGGFTSQRSIAYTQNCIDMYSDTLVRSILHAPASCDRVYMYIILGDV